MTTAEGGICVPLIVSGLDVQRGKIDTSNLMHVTDLFPTVLDYVGISRPDVYRGKKLAPLYGKSLRATFSSETPSRTDNEAICFEMAESKAVIKGQWKATLLLPPYGDGMHWKLYDISRDYSEKKRFVSSIYRQTEGVSFRLGTLCYICRIYFIRWYTYYRRNRGRRFL